MDEQVLASGLIVEAGVRQAWPYLTILDTDRNEETRLWLDTDIMVLPRWTDWSDQDSEQTFLALLSLNSLWISDVGIDANGSLKVVFNEGPILLARADGNAKTTSSPWHTAVHRSSARMTSPDSE